MNLFENAEDQNIVFAANPDSSNSSKTNDNTKSNFNFNFEVKDGANKKITVQKVSENETTILVNEV